MINQTVQIPVGDLKLEGMLEVPEGSNALVVFVHGSGSSRFSKRNNAVAEVLRGASMGTLLFDLLTEEEDEVYETRFNIPLLTERIKAVTEWLRAQDETKDLNLGYFGSSTGAAAAINAAADIGTDIKAVVSRGGRPDIAEQEAIDTLKSPILFIVGGDDAQVIPLNQQVYDQVWSEKEISIIPGATHLFEEPGKLEEVSRLATDWFSGHLK